MLATIDYTLGGYMRGADTVMSRSRSEARVLPDTIALDPNHSTRETRNTGGTGITQGRC
jgi:hypothetical protein